MCYFLQACRQWKCTFPQSARPVSFASVSTGWLQPLQDTGAVNNSWLPGAAGERFHRHATVRQRPHETSRSAVIPTDDGQLIKNRSTVIKLAFLQTQGTEHVADLFKQPPQSRPSKHHGNDFEVSESGGTFCIRDAVCGGDRWVLDWLQPPTTSVLL